MGDPSEELGSGVLPVITVDELTAQIASGIRPDSVLAFDADGTLWSGDIGMDSFKAVLAQRLLRDDPLAALGREAAASGVALATDANEQARLLYEAFEDGRYPEDRAFAMMAWSLAGYTAADVRTMTDGVIDAVGLASRLLPEAVAVLRWATSHAVPVVIVSASPMLVVEAAVARLDLPVSRVFGMRAAMRGSVLEPWLAGTPTYGPGKAQTLREALGDAPVAAAFGDSAFDLPMLRAAELKVAVRPKRELVARRGECPGLTELARLSGLGS